MRSFFPSFLCAIWIGCFLSSVSFAEDILADDQKPDFTQVYHVFDKDDVDMIATVTYLYEDHPKLSVKSVYPQLESDIENDNITQFNSLVKEVVDNEIDDFKNRIEQYGETPKKSAKKLRKNTLTIDFSASGLTSNNNQILSIRLTIQGYIAGIAHPYHKYAVINYNLSTNQKIELTDLFNSDTEYLSLLSQYIQEQRHNHFSSQLMQREIEDYKNWNLKPNGLFITLDEDQASSHLDGTQNILIPYSHLKPIISSHSLLAKCLKRKNCVQKNLLTGGFIDEL